MPTWATMRLSDRPGHGRSCHLLVQVDQLASHPVGVKSFASRNSGLPAKFTAKPRISRESSDRACEVVGIAWRVAEGIQIRAHQLRSACQWLAADGQPINTDRFIEYLRSQRMASNVDLAEVQAVDLHDLKGIDDVIEALEANIILPLEDDRLAGEMNIKPKRGVLLAGPPAVGTAPAR